MELPVGSSPRLTGQVGLVIAELAGGVEALLSRAREAAESADLRLACHLVDMAAWAAPEDPTVHADRAAIYWQRRKSESSLMAKGIYAAARESESVADPSL